MKKALCIILTIILSTSLSGCWSRKEPKTLALVNSVIYDLSDNGGYQVTIEVVNPAALGGISGDGSGKSPNIIAMCDGKFPAEAIRNISESLDRTIFGGHNKVRFFSERFAQKDITAALDYLSRDHLTDENPLMVVIRSDSPEQVYSCTLGLSQMVGDYIKSLSDTQPDTTSKAVFVRTLDFIKDYYSEGKQPVVGVVELVEHKSKPSNRSDIKADSDQGGAEQEYRIVYKGLAAFKDKQLVGYMNEVEARAYNFITNNIKKAVVSIVSENNETVVIVYNPRAQVKTQIKNGQITVDIKIKTFMSVIQENSNIDISKMEPIKVVEAAFNQQMADEITAAIQKAQVEFQSDIFGFGQSVHKQHPEKWREIKGSWDHYFAKAVINVSVESTVDRLGEIKQPFGMEVES